MTRLYLIGGAVLGLFVMTTLYGKMQYRSGVKDAVTKYEQADIKGAENVRNTSERILRDIGVIDTDELLESTNGWRD